MKEHKIKIRFLLVVFMMALFLSGLTAIPVAPELKWLLTCLPGHSPLSVYMNGVLTAYLDVQRQHEFLLYGYDWLAFAHFVLTVLFIGPYKDPVRNVWVIQFGMIACVMVLPFALIAGYLRGLPFWWRLIDCSFGIFGYILLHVIHRLIRKSMAGENASFQTHKIYAL